MLSASFFACRCLIDLRSRGPKLSMVLSPVLSSGTPQLPVLLSLQLSNRWLQVLVGTLRCLHRLLDSFRIEMPHRDLDHLGFMSVMRMMHLLRVAMCVMHLLSG